MKHAEILLVQELVDDPPKQDESIRTFGQYEIFHLIVTLKDC